MQNETRENEFGFYKNSSPASNGMYGLISHPTLIIFRDRCKDAVWIRVIQANGYSERFGNRGLDILDVAVALVPGGEGIHAFELR